MHSLLQDAYAARMNNLKRSIELAEEALALSRNIQDIALIAKSLSQLSLYLMIMGDYEPSMQYSQEAMKYFEELHDDHGIADAKYNIAGIYYKTDNYHLGLSYLIDALVIYRKFNDYHNESRTAKSMGTIYEYFGDQKNAVISYENAIEAARKVPDLNLESNAYNNLSGVYLKQGRIEEALQLAERSVVIKKQTGDRRGLAFAIYGRGKVYARTQRHTEAEQDFLDAMAIHREMGERLGLGMVYCKLAALYVELGSLSKAKKYLQYGQQLSDQFNIVIIKFKCDYLLYQVYKAENNHEQALQHLERYIQEKEIVINSQTLKVIENYELITRMRTLEQEAQSQREKAEIMEKKDRAEEALRIRQEFLSTMSHEIRTPLNAVVTITALLKDKSDPEEMQLLDSLRFAGNNLLIVINDILDFTELESGKAKLEMRQTQVKPLLENIWHTYESLAKDKGLKLSLKTDIALAQTYDIDETKLSQILGNLISNAIKFTEQGRVVIEVEKVEESGETDLLRFQVSDTGEGIPEKHLDEIFDIFSQIKPITTRKQGGTGLGLAIVKKLVDLHGGVVDVNSKVGSGSVFSFQIRYRRGNVPQKTETAFASQLQNKTALLAEDNEINAFVAITLLTRWGVVAERAVNGKEAVEKARQRAYDFILMDIHMPEMNGFDATANIRTSENPNKHTPIFAFTADVTAGQDENYASFFNGFLWKPLQMEKLHDALISVL